MLDKDEVIERLRSWVWWYRKIKNDDQERAMYKGYIKGFCAVLGNDLPQDIFDELVELGFCLCEF